MADGIIQVPPDSTGKKVDAASMDVGLNTVMRQRIVIGDNSATAQFALVTAGALTVTGNINISATPSVVLAAGTANFGTLNDISKTVQVAIGTPFTINNISATANVVVGAGTANIGFINNISATVTVAGVVGLTAGTAVIGDLNAISRTVQVAIGTPFTVNNISATVNAVVGAGTSNIGFINNISATVIVAGVVSLGAGAANIGIINNISATVIVAGVVSLGAGAANIGFINNISATVVVGLSYVIEKTTNSQVQVGDSLNAALRVNIVADSFASAVIATMSVSHGPKCVTASTSANVTLITGPGAGVSVYITQLVVTNGSPLNTLARIGTSASILTVCGYMASAGGGFVTNFDPPWKLSASEAALCSVKPNATGNCYFTVNFYVAA